MMSTSPGLSPGLSRSLSPDLVPGDLRPTDLTRVLHRVTDAVENLPCGAEHSFTAQLRRDSLALRERVVRAGMFQAGVFEAGNETCELVAEAERLLGRISEYLAATGALR